MSDISCIIVVEDYISTAAVGIGGGASITSMGVGFTICSFTV